MLINFWREFSIHQSQCRKHHCGCNTENLWLLQHDSNIWALKK